MSKFLSLLASLPIVLSACGCGLARMWAASGSYTAVENIGYIPGSPHHGHRLDLFLPPNPASAGVPVVVFIHGGYWRNQDKQYYRALTGLYSNVGIALARRGMAAAVINYRLVPDVKIDDQIQDVSTAIRWVADNIKSHGGNPNLIFLWGHSAGGHLSLLTAADKTLRPANFPALRGVVSMSGILDLNHMEKNNDAAFNDETTYTVFGRDADVLTRYSPIEHLKPGTPPLLILTGSNDFAYIREQTALAAPALMKRGVRADLREIPGLDHSDMVLTIGTNKDALTPAVVGFIENLVKETAGGTAE